MMKLFVGFVLTAIFTSSAFSQLNCSDEKKIDARFPLNRAVGGKTLRVAKDNYLIETVFDRKCKLVQLIVADASRWQDGDEEEGPGLPIKDYREIRARISDMFPLGKLRESDSIGISTPRGTSAWFVYQSAMIELVSYEREEKGKRDGLISSLKIYFAHEVTGRLIGRTLRQEKGFITKGTITVDESIYISDEQTGKLNETGRFRVFGSPVI